MWGSYPGFAGVNPFMAAANPFPGLGRTLSGAGPSAPAAAPPAKWPVIANNHPKQRGGKRPGESHHDYLMRQ